VHTTGLEGWHQEQEGSNHVIESDAHESNGCQQETLERDMRERKGKSTSNAEIAFANGSNSGCIQNTGLVEWNPAFSIISSVVCVTGKWRRVSESLRIPSTVGESKTPCCFNVVLQKFHQHPKLTEQRAFVLCSMRWSSLSTRYYITDYRYDTYIRRNKV
jgi:hypothetical protein